MSETGGRTFGCPSCGVHFVWRKPLAGKTVTCTCGKPLAVPAEKAGSVGRALPGSVAAAYPESMGGAYRAGRREAEQVGDMEEDDRGWFRCYVIPPVLILLGVAIDVSQISWKKPQLPSRVTIYPGEMVVLATLAVVTIVLAIFLLSTLFRMSFGRFWVAAMKGSAITLFGTAVGMMLVRLDKDVTSIYGLGIGWSSMILIYLALFGLLFKLEIHETVATVFVVAMGQALVIWAVLG